MTAWKSWFPVGQAHVSRARAVLEPCLEAFGQAWLNDASGLRIETMKPVSRSPEVPAGASTWRFGEDVSVTATPNTLCALAESALHYRSGPREQAGAGRAILESLALKQLAWLASTAVGELTGIEPAMRDLHAEEGSAALGPHVDSTIVLAQREVRVSLSISAQMLKAPEQRRVPRPLPPLGALRDAVLSSKVKVSALMGRTRLRVAELRRLSTGDVVLLDRNVHSPIEIRIGGGPAAALAAYPCALGNRILLQTTRAGSQRLNHGG